ncbi:MAG TPA: hypothetical protein VMB50_01175 [Myxococcales bacterium]|nr:hypothetical protein [Myxococcales bacterium]
MGFPLSLWPVSLVPALAGLYLAGRRLACAAVPDASLGRWLAPGLGLALWLVAAQALGLAFHSFGAALWGGTLAVAALGVAGAFRRPAVPPGEPPSRWIWLGVAVAVAIGLAVVFPGQHCDDVAWNAGHYSIPMEMLNGVYPPRHLVFPTYELRYHYGFDLLCALVASLFHLRIDRAVQWVTVICWAYAVGLLWRLGERVVGRAHGWIAVPAAFGCGLPFLCESRTSKSLGDHLTGAGCTIDKFWLAGPHVSDFFVQHPWTLGIPLALSALLLFDRRDRGAPWGWYAALGVVLAALSFSEVVLFACLAVAGFGAAAIQVERGDRRSLLRMLLLAVATAVVARALHGFFASAAEPSGLRLTFAPFWIGKTRTEWLLWHLYSFGLLLPLAVAGLWLLRSRGLIYAIMVLVGLAVLNTFQYASSGDIVKFAIVCRVPMGVLAAAALARFWARPWAPVALALSAAGGVAWVAQTAQAARLADGCFLAPLPTGDDARAVEWLRRHAAPGEGVFGTGSMEAYAIWGGVPISFLDNGVKTFGFSQALLDQRGRLENDKTIAPEEFVRQGFPWMVVAGAPDARVAGWFKSGQARVEVKLGKLSILRLGGGSG